MNKKTEYIILCEQADNSQPISYEAFMGVLKFLEEHGLLNTDALDVPKKPTPDLDTFAERLIELTDRAEEYRDMLEGFIAQADALLDELDGEVDDDWDDGWDDAE